MNKYYERVSSIIAAIVFLQTLYFKFSAAPESIYIFSKMGMEPYGRIGLGILELITAILLLFRKTSLVGALVGLGVITGAILSHLFVLGIEVQGDGGRLFALALLVLAMCAITIILQRNKLSDFVKSGWSPAKLL